MKKFIEFISYHNAIPIALGIVFLGAGGALAASPEVRQAVYYESTSVVSVDNTFLRIVDMNTFPFSLTVTAVTEDTDAYYVTYSLSTIALVDGAWREWVRTDELRISRDALRGEDLGAYVSRQFLELRTAERARLIETQSIEREVGSTVKTVATEYGGLVGAVFDALVEVEQPYVTEQPTAAGPSPQVSDNVDQSAVLGTAIDIYGNQIIDTEPPRIQMLGNNPARIPKKSIYADLGVIVTDDKMLTIGYTVAVDGVLSGASPTIDTSEVGVYEISYTAVDAVGNQTVAVRMVEVYDPYALE